MAINLKPTEERLHILFSWFNILLKVWFCKTETKSEDLLYLRLAWAWNRVYLTTSKTQFHTKCVKTWRPNPDKKFGGLHMNQSNTDMCAQVSKLPCFDFVPAAVYHILLRYMVTILPYMGNIIWWHNAWWQWSRLWFGCWFRFEPSIGSLII